MTPATETVAWLEILSGTTGYLLVAGFFLVAPLSAPMWAYTLTGAFLAVLIYAGRELRAGTQRGLRLSIVLQVIQSIHVAVPGLQVFCVAGPFADLTVSPQWVGLRGGIGAVALLSSLTPGFFPGAQFSVSVGLHLKPIAGSIPVAFAINVIAPVAAWHLWRALRAASIPAPSTGADSTPTA